MKGLRKILVKILGLKGYLKLVSKTYLRMVGMGMMKSKYPELFFLDKIIKKDAHVMDIGANLGYYSKQMVRLAAQGHTYAVEPIPLFAEVWKSNVPQKENVTLFNVALGDKDETVEMAIPMRDGVVRHGLTKVVSEEDSLESFLKFQVEMKKGDDLFSGIKKLDFLKCDVEGYEQFVIKSISALLSNLKPLIQIELNGDENRENVIADLTSNGYTMYVLENGKLVAADIKNAAKYAQDFYACHESKMDSFKSLF